MTSVWLGAARRSVQVRLSTSGCMSEKMSGIIIIVVVVVVVVVIIHKRGKSSTQQKKPVSHREELFC